MGGAIELFLFQKHPFVSPLLFISTFALPWLIFYFPGTLQWDAHAQLWVFLGVPSAIARAGEHPVILTEIMGGCIWLGRTLFQSDTIGLFIYTITQFMIQTLTFAYACFVLWKLKVPILFRWAALLYWGIYPFFPIWGYTMVKDTPFYIFILLLVVVLMDIFCAQEANAKWWQVGAVLFGAAGTMLSRNDGIHVVLITFFSAFVLYRKYWKISLAGIAFSLLLSSAVNNVYLPSHNIAKGNKADMLSLPLQQTARYVRDHFDEITEEEAAILQEGFTVEWETIGREYDPFCADPVKDKFWPQPTADYLKAYFWVWRQQFRRHPDTYVQAFLNHVYGYFYPDQRDYLYDELHLTANFYIGNTDKWHDGYLDIEFGIRNGNGRKILQHFFYLTEKMPILSMLTSPGFHAYILLGECACLFSKKRRREMLFLIPGIFILLLRLFSPINGSIRYIIPIMAVLPVTAAWCYVACRAEKDAPVGYCEQRSCE